MNIPRTSKGVTKRYKRRYANIRKLLFTSKRSNNGAGKN